jgi:plasmid stabilization system protein ParE
MAHKVGITPEAEADIQAILEYISLQAPETALRFVISLRRRIASLKNFPARHSKAAEAELAGLDVRQAVHGMYRVLYTFDERTVTVHAVRHGARRPLRADELPKPS